MLIALAKGHAYATPIRSWWRQTVATATRRDRTWNTFKSKTDQAGVVCVFQACVGGNSENTKKRKKKREVTVTAIVTQRTSVISNRIKKKMDGLLFVFRINASWGLTHSSSAPRHFFKLHSSFHITIKDQTRDRQICRTHGHTLHCQRPFRQTKLNSGGLCVGDSRVWLLNDTNLLQIASLHLISCLWHGNNNVISKCWHLSHPTVFFLFDCLFVLPRCAQNQI